ncbi:GntR family transcriptional regulator [Bacillus tamaricis]|uniref:GntR family transcriptional regulator n=2 Tax=Evansella tamaricis TaxID=2069301 RepID=A0ABS6JKJ8_9BACI|nr:GntR family transcriptional regulator [Evansella tamaricis]MBU9713347.1 GntR family transcriptional regulator [Evansella tamaricis]
MWIHLNNEDSRPLYVQVKEQLMRDILNGSLKPGEELPSIRKLAKEAKTSVITVKRAYHDLELEGYIYTRAGKGSFVKQQNEEEQRIQKVKMFTQKAEELIHFGRTQHLSDEEMKTALLSCFREERGKE